MGDLLMLGPPHLQTVMLKVPFHSPPSILPCICVQVLMRFLFCALCFLVCRPPPHPMLAFDLLRRLAGVADAILGMVSIGMLFLLLLHLRPPSLLHNLLISRACPTG
jgi:hypothetical protein